MTCKVIKITLYYYEKSFSSDVTNFIKFEDESIIKFGDQY